MHTGALFKAKLTSNNHRSSSLVSSGLESSGKTATNMTKKYFS